jgi:hypothetical protein
MKIQLSNNQNKACLPFREGNTLFRQGVILGGDIHTLQFTMNYRKYNGGTEGQVVDLICWRSPQDKDNTANFKRPDNTNLQYRIPDNCIEFYIESEGEGDYAFTLEVENIPSNIYSLSY